MNRGNNNNTAHNKYVKVESITNRWKMGYSLNGKCVHPREIQTQFYRNKNLEKKLTRNLYRAAFERIENQ